MTDHPITPPPELLARWEEDWHHSKVKHIELEDHIATQAARWGADQELEACCEWLDDGCEVLSVELRRARRPKPPSLKEQALQALDSFEGFTGSLQEVDTIRRALETLPE